MCIRLRTAFFILAILIATPVRAADDPFPDYPGCVFYNLSNFTVTTWLNKPYVDVQFGKWIRHLIEMSAEERETFKQYMELIPVENPEVKKILNLVLYDEKAWDDFIAEVAEDTHRYNFANALAPVLAKMPEALQDRLLKRIGALYPVVPKEKNRQITPMVLKTFEGPRRALDTFITYGLRSQEFMQSQVQSGKTPVEAFGDFIKWQKEKAFADVSQGNYSADDILKLAENIQQKLISSMDLRNRRISVDVYGSFPNGRADLATSDLDIAMSQKILADEKINFFQDVRNAIQQTFGKQQVALRPSLRDDLEPEEAALYGIVMPMKLRISEKKIELLVYPQTPIHPGILQNHKEAYPTTVYILSERP